MTTAVAGCGPAPTIEQEYALVRDATSSMTHSLEDVEPLVRKQDAIRAAWSVPTTMAWREYIALVAPRLEVHGYTRGNVSEDLGVFLKHPPGDVFTVTITRRVRGGVAVVFTARPD